MKQKSKPVDYEKAKKQLHVSAVPDNLPCREKEYEEIYGYVNNSLTSRCGTCVYISGVPGTGKTATIRQVVQECKKTNSFKYLEVNAMKLTDCFYIYVLMYQALVESKRRKKISPALAQEYLKDYFLKTKKNSPLVMLVDELDRLVNKSQTVLYNIFNWPKYSNLIILAISNTMDLPERLFLNKISSRLGICRVDFKPYSHQQMNVIIQSRLNGCNAFDAHSVNLCCRKVCNVSGDARRALDICRRAIEVAEQKTCLVNPEIIQKVIEEMSSSVVLKAVSFCSLHQKILLLAFIQDSQVTGLAESDFRRVRIILSNF